MSIPLTDQEFRVLADEALETLQQALFGLADEEDFEVDLQGGVLNILFEEPTPARFVISPNAPVRQIWVSALVKSFKLGWEPARRVFSLGDESLEALVTRLVHQHLGR
jgi:iron donor protein CyaY